MGEERHFDEELDKHMMQTIADVKYVRKRPKFVAVGKFRFKMSLIEVFYCAVRVRKGQISLKGRFGSFRGHLRPMSSSREQSWDIYNAVIHQIKF